MESLIKYLNVKFSRLQGTDAEKEVITEREK